jgi:hypothetical protein
MALATISLPVPLSPINDDRRIGPGGVGYQLENRCIGALTPIMP